MSRTNLNEIAGVLVGRVWVPDTGPVVVTLRDGEIYDITTRDAPTVSQVMEMDDPAAYVIAQSGSCLASLSDLEAESLAAESNPAQRHFLAPNDLQAVKAAGVTFAHSMVERVIEERAAGDPNAAKLIRSRIGELIDASLSNIKPGSMEAEKVKQALIAEGLWSQYLEVGIGPDAEVFSKAQPLSAVGWGAPVGLAALK